MRQFVQSRIYGGRETISYMVKYDAVRQKRVMKNYFKLFFNVVTKLFFMLIFNNLLGSDSEVAEYSFKILKNPGNLFKIYIISKYEMRLVI